MALSVTTPIAAGYLIANVDLFEGNNPDRDGFYAVEGALLEDVETTVEAVADGGQPPETRSKWYAEFLVERGIADVDEMNEKPREKIRPRAVSGLREQNGKMARERYDRRSEREKAEQRSEHLPDI